ncbi:hypothetical protein CLTEP_20580 [Clostridium tepidiprofundi DSM 19306]|uniref:CorA-like Mg2+ transporter protein n=1 Tax=Clostridium tepidiprofundi DSM 19306 TaxID=1121338 RepID=A0A151B2A3_9CLOT|nr:hypothetical protein [Clostridium tepidiprofundi]KYH34006.1 hypothetical protein CLTEP_20580 [Clostridium tepidiprofundi DSM 19306]
MGNENNKSNEPKVLNQLNYHILPFAFKKDYCEVIKGIEASNEWKWQKNMNTQVFTHIENLVFSENNKETIGRKYILLNDSKVREKYGLPSKKTETLRMYVKNNSDYTFKIMSMEMYIFETNVGFILFEIEFVDKKSNVDIEHIINGNYFFKKFAHSNNIKIYYNKKGEYNKELGKAEYIQVEFSRGKIVSNITNDFDVDTFFTRIKKPENCLVFNSVTLDRIPQENMLEEYLFRMRRSFKDSYRPSPLEFNVENNNEILRMFENSYWGVSLEGIGNITYSTKDSFFASNYKGNLKSTYIYMYILGLHKRYALLYLSMRISRLPNTIKEYIKYEKKHKENILYKFREKIVFFKFRCVFNETSNITHQAKLFDMIENTLRIEQLLNEMESEIEALTSMIEMKEFKSKSELREFVAAASLIFAVISTIVSGWELVKIIEKENFPPVNSNAFFTLLVLTFLLVFLVFTGAKLIFKIKKEMK